jgi:hypothetical protein
MKLKCISTLLLSLGCIAVCGQNNPVDFSVFSAENIEFKALKPSFRLIRHEYILLDNGNTRTRGGNDYYGKIYSIGVLDDATRLWYPEHIKTPWLHDETLDKELLKSCTPKCFNFCIKDYYEQDFFETKLQDTSVNYIHIGKFGIPFEDSLRQEGTLVIFYTSVPSPDDFSTVSYSLISLKDLIWSREGICEIDELHYGSNKIIGGALFSRYINPGKVNWELIGFYIPAGDKWVIKAINTLK